MASDTTVDDVLSDIDLSGRVALITGASAGLGVETTRALTAHGCTVIGGVRDRRKAASALSAARAAPASYELRELDLADLASVRAFTNGVLRDTSRIDFLIANAGVMSTPEGRTKDGFETQFGVNHLGHFVLVNRLVALLVNSAPSRVVILSSAGHRRSDVSLEDPHFESTPYSPVAAYGRSKTANALFAVELDRRLRGHGVRATAVHPGAVGSTELSQHQPPELKAQMAERMKQRQTPRKTLAMGTATTVWAMLAAGEQIGGRYCEDTHVSQIVTDPDAPGDGVMDYAVDPRSARALWARSEELVGESFTI